LALIDLTNRPSLSYVTICNHTRILAVPEPAEVVSFSRNTACETGNIVDAGVLRCRKGGLRL
jgi:hypothetical protein